MEEGRDHGVEAGEVGAKTSAERKQAGEERNDGEEERDQVEGEHETAHVVVLVGADEGLRDIVVRAEVPRRVEGQSRVGVAAVDIVAIVGAADGKEGPSRRVTGEVAA